MLGVLILFSWESCFVFDDVASDFNCQAEVGSTNERRLDLDRLLVVAQWWLWCGCWGEGMAATNEAAKVEEFGGDGDVSDTPPAVKWPSCDFMRKLGLIM